MSVFLDILDAVGGVGGASALGIGGTVATTIMKVWGKRMERRNREELAKFEARTDATNKAWRRRKHEILSRLAAGRAMMFDALGDCLDQAENGHVGIIEHKHDVRLKSIPAPMTSSNILLMVDQKAKDAMNHDVFDWFEENWEISRYHEISEEHLDSVISEDAERFRSIFVTRVKKDAGKSDILCKVLDESFSYEYARNLYDGIVRYALREKYALDQSLEEIEGKKLLA